MFAADAASTQRPATALAVCHQHELRPRPYVVGYSGYIPGLMFQYGRTFAKAAEDCVVTFLKQQEERLTTRHVEAERRCKSLPRMRSVRNEEVEKTRHTFTYALEEDYPPLPGYTGHIPKVSRTSVIGRSVASATRRVREKSTMEQKVKEINQDKSVERYQEQTASSRAKQVHLTKTHHESVTTVRSATSNVNKVSNQTVQNEVDGDTADDQALVADSDYPESEKKEIKIENDGANAQNIEDSISSNREERASKIFRQEIVKKDEQGTSISRIIRQEIIRDSDPGSIAEQQVLAGQIKCIDCNFNSDSAQHTETGSWAVESSETARTRNLSTESFIRTTSARSSFHQSMIMRTTRHESHSAGKHKEVHKSLSPSKDNKSQSPKKSEPKAAVQFSPKKSDSRPAAQTSPNKSDNKTSPLKMRSQTKPKTQPSPPRKSVAVKSKTLQASQERTESKIHTSSTTTKSAQQQSSQIKSQVSSKKIQNSSQNISDLKTQNTNKAKNTPEKTSALQKNTETSTSRKSSQQIHETKTQVSSTAQNISQQITKGLPKETKSSQGAMKEELVKKDALKPESVESQAQAVSSSEPKAERTETKQKDLKESFDAKIVHKSSVVEKALNEPAN
ncbi:uncharacterized protein LOC108665603 isoform X2 [Hyalella azteca]|uniref:Uncharacterized protein LOC108665603 isoform X2 n=1 Tax=Hyalella azteca TaxID=294128 RepID=A0A8B7N1Z3_HYAAZ|nr:uncharacterized protein LOC108665603 isoform X2 [Hyalella azteca]